MIAEGHAQDRAQDLSGFAGRESQGEVEGQDPSQPLGGAMQACQVEGGRLRSGRGQLSGLQRVLPILVAKLELGEAQLL